MLSPDTFESTIELTAPLSAAKELCSVQLTGVGQWCPLEVSVKQLLFDDRLPVEQQFQITNNSQERVPWAISVLESITVECRGASTGKFEGTNF